jgi:predicted transglutaminase-like cysteine proteinase
MRTELRVFTGAWLVLALLLTGPAFAAHTPATDRSFEPDTLHEALFGSRETFGVNLAKFPYWTDMLARTQAEFAAATKICARGKSRNCTPPEWARLLKQMQGKTLPEKLKIANDAMNRHRYVTTAQNWHRAMYWEAPFQFLRRGGQCQDYAIAKYELLRQAGVPADDLRMVVLHASSVGADHAVLAAYVDGVALLLDNLRPDIVRADAVEDYHPYYSINEDGWWYHTGGQAYGERFASIAR